MAHRWSLGKVSKHDARHGQWDINQFDLLEHFLSTLPRPSHRCDSIVDNKHGDGAQLSKLVYRRPATSSPLLYHGTTYRGLRDILQHGLVESSDPTIHEFTTPGIYVADDIRCSLYYHATATKMLPRHEAVHSTPYVRFLLRVEALCKPRKVSSYGYGKQLVFPAGGVRVCELHVYRGWHFIDAGEKVMFLDDAIACRLARSVPTQLSAPVVPRQLVVEPPAPPPPPFWHEYITDSCRKYYFNPSNGNVQWAKPSSAPLWVFNDGLDSNLSVPTFDLNIGVCCGGQLLLLLVLPTCHCSLLIPILY